MRSASAGAEPALLVVDWWEKLAGASLALSAVIHLCRHARVSLVAPAVRSSLFQPASSTTWPLSSYYDTGTLGNALAPMRLVTHGAWLRKWRRSNGTSIAVVYSDYPAACVAAMANGPGPLLKCPQACLASAGLRRLVDATQRWLGEFVARMRCVSATELRAIVGGEDGRLGPFLRRSPAVALLNFRRHDNGRPMLAPTRALALRATAVQPAAHVRAAAHSFLVAQGVAARQYVAVHMRSNHLAHAAHRAGSSVCAQRISACARRLSRTARRIAPSARTVVASDLATLFEVSQDGDTHRRQPYFRECLLPALPGLQKWFDTAGSAFRPANTTCATSGATSRSARSGARRQRSNASALPLACDAGFLGLVDWVLATEARAFAAVEVRQPWRSAFLEWIVQARRLRGAGSELITCV
jgi:hypothetical protein